MNDEDAELFSYEDWIREFFSLYPSGFIQDGYHLVSLSHDGFVFGYVLMKGREQVRACFAKDVEGPHYPKGTGWVNKPVPTK